MEKLKGIRGAIWVFITIINVCFFISSVAEAGRDTSGTISTELTIIDTGSEWRTYHSKRWSYLVEYPAGWAPGTSIENEGGDEYVIREEVTFSDQIAIAVWTNISKLTFSQWFEVYKYWLAGEEAIVFPCTATILMLPAICVIEPQTPQSYEDMKCFFQKDDRIFRVRYTNSDQNKSLEIYTQMILSFRFDQ